MHYMSNIGQVIKAAREAKEWTQKELATRAGVSQGTVGHIESGRNKSTTKLLEIARALGLKPEEIGLRTALPETAGNASQAAEESLSVPPSLSEVAQRRAAILEKSLMLLSREMRELVEILISIDRAGGADREMTIAGIRYILQARRDLPSYSGKDGTKTQQT
nr:helix-turn-helix transcriptional regulator [Burkholderia pseudomallei]